jgi:diketogulonate reductase-like aldo/keto reductase
MEFATLNNGIKMPTLGFGVYRIQDLAVCEQSVCDAIEAGYRLIDTASLYHNEEAVGKAIKQSGVPREELFITTKLWLSDAGYESTIRAFDESLSRLQLDYLDLYLIHQPFNDTYGSWRAMEELYKANKVRAIGISNFSLDRLVDLGLFNEVAPMVNQIEIHPFYGQTEAVEYMQKDGVIAEAWSPLAAGRNDIFTNDTLAKVGARYGKSIAQVTLRWLVQRGIVAIPKSVRKERIIENISIFDFGLDEDDMKAIAVLDTKQSAYFSFSDPAIVKQFKDFGK